MSLLFSSIIKQFIFTKLKSFLVVITSLALFACSENKSTQKNAVILDNASPVASAGADQTAPLGIAINLNGDASYDPESDVIYYLWQILSTPEASNASLNNENIVNPSFVADIAGEYVLELSVHDGNSTNTDQIIIITSTENIAPISNAGDDIAIAEMGTVTLSGLNSFDNNLDPLSYSWSLISTPEGSTASLNDDTSSTPSFFAEKEGEYTISLIVNDGFLNSNEDTVIVRYQDINQTPTAVAGDDQTVSFETIQLDGSRSADANFDTLTYTWTLVSRPEESTVSLSNDTIVNPSFFPDFVGSYVWSLIVNDGTTNSIADTVAITVLPENEAPIADAGASQSVSIKDVTLDGSNSNDPDGDTLTYSWSLVSRPTGSNASLSVPTAEQPNFTVDIEGPYQLSLVVSDGQLNSEADQVIITYTVPRPSDDLLDDFSGSGALTGVVTNNASALPNVSKSEGRYRAFLDNNNDNITLHFNEDQGRLDAWETRFPFEFIARNIGIGSVSNSQTPHAFTSSAYNFSGVQVHVQNLDSANSSHVVVGHRGTEASFTIEGKNTVNGTSRVNDIGTNTVPNTRADIRIVGDTNGDITVYWQLPNFDVNSTESDDWNLYGATGELPGEAPNYGSTGSRVYIGLITYAFGSRGIPFIGTCDSVELIEN